MLGLLNFVVLQWFGVRLARCSCEVPLDADLERRIRNGPSGWAHQVDGWEIVIRQSERAPQPAILRRLKWWAVIGPIVPLTGWWSPYIPKPRVLARFGDYPSRGA
jgi:hypothetical protein